MFETRGFCGHFSMGVLTLLDADRQHFEVLASLESFSVDVHH